MQDRFIFANGAFGASWANLMGQVEHGLRLAMAQLAPSKQIRKKNNKKLFFKWLPFQKKY